MLNKKISRRLAALTLAMLLVLCSGCGSSAEPAADTPAPSQTAASPEVSADPNAEQAPVPEAATTPTDVNAPSAVPLPQLENPIERETPASLQLLALGGSFTLTNAEGQTVTRAGSEVTGSMDFSQQLFSGDSGDVASLQIPYSDNYTIEASGVSGDWGFEFLATACPWCHCVAKGSGKLTGLEYKTGSSLTVRTEPGAELELTLPMAGNSLGDSGWVRLHLTAGENEVSIAVENGGGGFSFSGVDTSASVLVDYGGVYSASGLDLAPKSSSGSASFGANGFTVS